MKSKVKPTKVESNLKRVDLEKITNELLSQLAKIESYKKPSKYKENRAKVAAETALNALNNAKNANGELEPLAAQTKFRYITKLRTAIREAGYKGYAFNDAIAALITAHAKRKAKLTAILEAPRYEAIKLIEAYIKELEKSEQSELISKLRAARKIIDPYILHCLIHADGDYDAIRPQKQKREDVQRAAEKTMSYEYTQIMQLIPQLLTSQDWEHIALGVSLATGRRMFEVLYLSRFVRKGSRSVTCYGIAKKEDSFDKQKGVEIPTLANSRLVIQAWERLIKIDRIKELRAEIDAITLDSDKALRLNASVKYQLTEQASLLMGNMILNQDGTPTLEIKKRTVNGREYDRASGLSFKICRDLYINCVWDEHTADKPELRENMNYKRHLIAETLKHANDDTASSYEKLINREAVNQKVMTIAHKHNESFKQNANKRLSELKALFDDERFKSKPIQKCLNYIIELVEKDPNVEITSYVLRNAKDKDGNSISLGKTTKVTEAARLIRELRLDKN